MKQNTSFLKDYFHGYPKRALLVSVGILVISGAFGQGPDDLSDVTSEVEDAWDDILNIIKYFYIGSLVIGGGYVIWAFSTKKQDASNYLIFWIVGMIVYFIMNALFF